MVFRGTWDVSNGSFLSFRGPFSTSVTVGERVSWSGLVSKLVEVRLKLMMPTPVVNKSISQKGKTENVIFLKSKQIFTFLEQGDIGYVSSIGSPS